MVEDVTWEEVLAFLSSHGIEANSNIEEFQRLVKDIESKVNLHKDRLIELEKGTEEYEAAEDKYKIMTTIYNQANRIKALPYEERAMHADSWVARMVEISGDAKLSDEREPEPETE